MNRILYRVKLWNDKYEASIIIIVKARCALDAIFQASDMIKDEEHIEIVEVAPD